MRQRIVWLGVCAVTALIVAGAWAVAEEPPAPATPEATTKAVAESSDAVSKAAVIKPAEMASFSSSKFSFTGPRRCKAWSRHALGVVFHERSSPACV